MTISGFRKAGHWPTLFASFLYFDVSFMVWVLLGPLGPFIGDALKLNASQKGFLVALPLLAGSFFRPILGVMADRLGGRTTGLIGLSVTLVPLLIGWQFASAYAHFLAIGTMLGIAGASFAVALPLASRWYPPEYQGLAMGIAGAGNSGTVFATLFAPRIATSLGYHAAFAIAAAPVLVVLVVFAFIAKDSPNRPKAMRWADYAEVLKQADSGWFCMLYSMTFGTFVGLASFLTMYFVEQYRLPKVTAGDFTTLAVISGSMLRPVGGMIADKIGGYKLLLGVLLGVGICLSAVSTVPPVSIALGVFIVCMGLLGMGNGAVFQILPQRFPGSVGIMTGVVGAAGGFGGFLLPSVLGSIKQNFGQFSYGFAMGAGVFFCGLVILLQIGHGWLSTWNVRSVERAGVFSYRGLTRDDDDAADLAA